MAKTYLSGGRIQGSSAAAGTESDYSQDTGSNDGTGFGNNNVLGNRIGSGNSLIGKTATKAKFYLKKTSSAVTGTMSGVVYRGDFDGGTPVKVHTFETKTLPDDLPNTDMALITFEGSSFEIQENDGIAVECNFTGGNSGVNIRVSTSYSNEAWRHIEYNAVVWSLKTGIAARMIVTAMTPIDEKTTITDVPIGTRFEETDTRKIFRRKGFPISITGLKAYYRFNESSGNIINQATTANGYTEGLNSDADLVMTGGTYGQSAPIGSANAVGFDGSGDFGIASTGSNTLSQFNFIHEGRSTICFWMKLRDAVNYGLVMDNTNWTSARGITILTESSRNINQQIQNGTNAIFDNNAGGSGYIPDTTDYHFYTMQVDVALTTGVAIMKRDNANSTTSNRQNAPSSSANSSYALNIGRRSNDTSYTDMAISELSIWNRVLTADEITTLYNSGAGQAITESWVEKGTA